MAQARYGKRHLIPRYLKVYPKTKGKEIRSLHAHTKTAPTYREQKQENKIGTTFQLPGGTGSAKPFPIRFLFSRRTLKKRCHTPSATGPDCAPHRGAPSLFVYPPTIPHTPPRTECLSAHVLVHHACNMWGIRGSCDPNRLAGQASSISDISLAWRWPTGYGCI